MAEEIVLADHSVPRIPLQDELSRLYSQGFLTDITLSTEDGKNFEAHKILLAARSHYFHSVVPRLKSDPVIFLKGVKGAHLDKILKFIYSGKVALSRHQLKPILEVAKSLQIAGLCDANPTDILQQQQPSALGASRFRPPATPSDSSSPHVLQRMQEKKLSSPLSPGSSFKTRGGRQQLPKTSPFGSRLANGSPPGSDSEEDKQNSDEEEEPKAPPPVATETPKPKRKRGRPPKQGKSRTDDSKDKASGDPYEFDEEVVENADDDDHSAKKNWRSDASAAKRSKGDEDDNESEATEAESSSSAAKRERSNKYATSSINGKQVLSVKCNDQNAELHLSRFANGIRGKSIMYKEEWMTPQEFELACGSTGKRYLENIQTDYGPLKTLTNSGLLKPHSRKCRCSICRGDESAKTSSPEKLRKAVEDWTTEDASTAGGVAPDLAEELGFVTKEEKQDDFDFGTLGVMDDVTQNFSRGKSDFKGGLKRKKKKHKNSDWKKELNEKVAQATMNMNLATTNDIIQQGMTMIATPAPMNNGLVVTTDDDLSSMSGTATYTYTSVFEMPPKISSPATAVQLTDRIEPPPIQQPTFYVMSPHPSAAPATPQHNPFSMPMPPPSPMMSPAPQLTPILQPPQTPPITLQHELPPVHTPSPVPPPALTTTVAATSTTPLSTISSTSSNDSDGESSASKKTLTTTSSTGVKFGPVMNVRCKSTTAVLYSCKYETGSKGKCINLGNEWLTPGEFEDRAGSKAKKYLSSIKCMGRPLRVYVNSGELKGSGPPPAPKPKKHLPNHPSNHKPTPIQPIAPAPPPASLTPAPITMAVAPPTPTHISSAPPVPANLNMMMGNPNAGAPILINQTSMGGNAIMGNQPIFNTPMTFTIAQPIEVRQNVSQTM